MTTYRGGDEVKGGFYWKRGKLDAEIVPVEGGKLPGPATVTFARVGWPLLLVIAPVLGGAFAMFLPFIGVAMLVAYLTGRLRKTEGVPPAAEAKADMKRAA
jgi:hypothetical protein